MEMMSHVWKCRNPKEFLILHKQHPQSSFENLTTFYMLDCHRIKYLFSPLMAKLLSNLHKIDISNCNGIEEVVSSRDDEEGTGIIYSPTSNTTFFPHLDILHLARLENLKRIDGGVIHDQHKFNKASDVSWSLCQYSTKIKIINCNALSTLVPSYALGQMQKLQELEIFETQGIDSNNTSAGSTSANTDKGNGGSTTLEIPRPKNITVTQLSNLQNLEIIGCKRLQHVFTFSTLKSLVQLQVLTVKRCEEIQVIVREENGEQTNNVVVFPFMKSIELANLQNLKGFFLGMNDFQWPLLDKVFIDNCPQIMVFTSGQSTAPELKYIHTSLGKHCLECGLNFHVTSTSDQALRTQLANSECTSISFSTNLECLPWSFHNLIEMDSKYMSYDVEKIIPSSELLQLGKLEKIYLKSLYVKEVFDIAMELEGPDINSVLNELQSVEIPNLRQVKLESLRHLKYLWKRNNLRVLEFPNLTTLSINKCERLEHVFTSSMLGSLPKLQDLRINDCKNMKVIVKEEEEKEEEVEEEEEEDGDKVKEDDDDDNDEEEEECAFNVNEIKLPCLKSLDLENLNILKGFCLGKEAFSWPSFDTLIIKNCPSIRVFTNGHSTTPKLQIIETSSGKCDVQELNSFIKTKRREGLFLKEDEDEMLFF